MTPVPKKRANVYIPPEIFQRGFRRGRRGKQADSVEVRPITKMEEMRRLRRLLVWVELRAGKQGVVVRSILVGVKDMVEEWDVFGLIFGGVPREIRLIVAFLR